MPTHYKNSPAPKAPKKEELRIGKEKIMIKPDALRNQLKIPDGKKIPMALLNKIINADTGDMVMNPFTKKNIKVTELLTKRASLARTLKTRFKK
jgi:hypothetical protein